MWDEGIGQWTRHKGGERDCWDDAEVNGSHGERGVEMADGGGRPLRVRGKKRVHDLIRGRPAPRSGEKNLSKSTEAISGSGDA